MKNLLLVLGILLSAPNTARAEDLDAGLAKLADNLASGISKSPTKKVSVIDFTDLQGNTSELGRYIAEQLSVSLVNSSKDFTVMDRANLKSLLDEHKLTASGLVNPENARKVGQFAGVDAIILGSITQFGETFTVTARVIATETSQVLAATKISIARSNEISAMLRPETAVPSAERKTATEKDFTAPNGTSIFGNIEVEIVSFKAPAPGTVIALVKVKNRSSSNALRIGLNSSGGNRQAGTFLMDDHGNQYPLAEVSGLSFTRHSGGERNTFEMLRRMAADGHEREYYKADLARDLDKNTDIGAGGSVIFTLQFAKRVLSPGSVYRFNAEIIVAEIFRDERVKVTLHNVVVPDIQPK